MPNRVDVKKGEKRQFSLLTQDIFHHHLLYYERPKNYRGELSSSFPLDCLSFCCCCHYFSKSILAFLIFGFSLLFPLAFFAHDVFTFQRKANLLPLSLTPHQRARICVCLRLPSFLIENNGIKAKKEANNLSFGATPVKTSKHNVYQ